MSTGQTDLKQHALAEECVHMKEQKMVNDRCVDVSPEGDKLLLLIELYVCTC